MSSTQVGNRVARADRLGDAPAMSEATVWVFD
jgi:hypothetical protein